MNSSDDFEPGRWTYKGQKYPWALPIPHPETDEKNFQSKRPGVCPLLLVGDLEILIRNGKYKLALSELEREAPMLRSLGRQDWDDWVSATRDRLVKLVSEE